MYKVKNRSDMAQTEPSTHTTANHSGDNTYDAIANNNGSVSATTPSTTTTKSVAVGTVVSSPPYLLNDSFGVPDRLNISRDDSDIGGEYFLRGGTTTSALNCGTLSPPPPPPPPPPSVLLSGIYASDHSQLPDHRHIPYTTTITSPLQQPGGEDNNAGVDSSSHAGSTPHAFSDNNNSRIARTPPRRLSSNSLYGEAIVTSGGGGGGRGLVGTTTPTLTTTTPPLIRLLKQTSTISSSSRNDVVIQEEDDISRLFRSDPTGIPRPMGEPLLQPQFRSHNSTVADELDSVSDSSCDDDEEELLLGLSPCHILLSPNSHNEDDCCTNNTNITPPSVQYAASLSPPPLVNDELRSQHLELLQVSRSRESLVLADSSQASQAQHGGTASTAASVSGGVQQPQLTQQQQQQPQTHRPPRAPNVNLRFHGGSGSVVQQSNNNNVTSSISSIVAFNSTNSNSNDQHSRAHSTGDASFLSALTDSDFDGGGGNAAAVDRNNNLGRTLQGGGSIHSTNSALQQSSWPERWDAYGPLQQDVRGMDIDIPYFLQQPILGDDDCCEGDNIPMNESIQSNERGQHSLIPRSPNTIGWDDLSIPEIGVTDLSSTRPSPHRDETAKVVAPKGSLESECSSIGPPCRTESGIATKLVSRDLSWSLHNLNSQFDTFLEVERRDHTIKSVDLFLDNAMHFTGPKSIINERGKRFEPSTREFWLPVSIIVMSSLCSAVLLYYCSQSPAETDSAVHERGKGSISWWMIFVGVRHPLVLSMAGACELCLHRFLSPYIAKALGPEITLMIALCRGWPGVAVLYGLFAFLLLHGDCAVARHWLFWQEGISVFSQQNHSGNILVSETYTRFLLLCISFGLLVTAKRFWLGSHLAKRLFARYGGEMKALKQHLALINVLSSLTLKDPDEVGPDRTNHGFGEATSRLPLGTSKVDEGTADSISRHPHTVSVGDLLDFREAVRALNLEFPFEKVDARSVCEKSIAALYGKLLRRETNGDILYYSTLCDVYLEADKPIQAKTLKQVFRPNGDGTLPLLTFIECIESIYSELCFTRKRMGTAYSLDSTYEAILELIFYTVLLLTSLNIMGVDTMPFVQAASCAAVALSFCIGLTSNKIVDGYVMVLGHRPYDVGDWIVVSRHDDATDPAHLPMWIVEDIGLLYTTVRDSTSSMDMRMIQNGNLAHACIINRATNR